MIRSMLLRTPCSRRAESVDLALAPLPVRRPQLELLQLAGRRAGELVAELDSRRRLVAGGALLAPRDQLGLGDLLTGSEHDERLDRLPPLLVGDADDGHLGD